MINFDKEKVDLVLNEMSPILDRVRAIRIKLEVQLKYSSGNEFGNLKASYMCKPSHTR